MGIVLGTVPFVVEVEVDVVVQLESGQKNWVETEIHSAENWESAPLELP
jgi:hypothetical protein